MTYPSSGSVGPTSSGGVRRSGDRPSWLAGLTLGAVSGFLLLEFPILGVAIFAAAAILIRRVGGMVAGTGGLLVGLGGMWLALFGRVKLTCTEDATSGSSCIAPSIDTYLVISLVILAVGAAISIVVFARSRRR